MCVYIYIYTIIQPWKINQGFSDIVISDNMDETRGHYARWYKPDREKQILNGITYMWNIKKKNVKLIETESEKVVARQGLGVRAVRRGW